MLVCLSLDRGVYRLESDEGQTVLNDFHSITEPYDLAKRIEQKRCEPVRVCFADHNGALRTQ